MAGGIQRACPACGFESAEVRCPRCNALKVVGCSGSCALCRDSSCKTKASSAPGARPSDAAADNDEMAGTPLER